MITFGFEKPYPRNTCLGIGFTILSLGLSCSKSKDDSGDGDGSSESSTLGSGAQPETQTADSPDTITGANLLQCVAFDPNQDGKTTGGGVEYGCSYNQSGEKHTGSVEPVSITLARDDGTELVVTEFESADTRSDHHFIFKIKDASGLGGNVSSELKVDGIEQSVTGAIAARFTKALLSISVDYPAGDETQAIAAIRQKKSVTIHVIAAAGQKLSPLFSAKVTTAPAPKPPFSYTNGFPGPSGDCGLEINASCDVDVTFQPHTIGVWTEEYSLEYFDGLRYQTVRADITGAGKLIAIRLMGQQDFDTVSSNPPVSSATLNKPTGLDLSANQLIITDNTNHRVLIAEGIAQTTELVGVSVIGQTDMTSDSPATTQTKLQGPTAASYLDGKLFIADASNNRIIQHTVANLASISDVSADAVLGQCNYTDSTPGTDKQKLNHPYDIQFDASRSLSYVVDNQNHRVLIWDSSLADFGCSGATPNAAYDPIDVIGQSDFSSGASGAVSSTTLFGPEKVNSFLGHLAVSDTNNHRILFWTHPTSPSTDYANAAAHVWGQPDMNSDTPNNGGASNKTLRNPRGVARGNDAIFVADSGNNRVLIWPKLEDIADHTGAGLVFGQEDFCGVSTNSGGTSPSSMSLAAPHALAIYESDTDPLMVVADTTNNRILIVPIPKAADWPAVSTEDDPTTCYFGSNS